MWLFYVYLIECMLSQRINILHDVFQHICESLCNQQCIFLYQSIANRKTGGGPGENGSICNIDTILQKAPVCCLRCYFFFPFSRHIFHTNCLLQMLPFFALFCLLSILCFAVKKWFSTKDISSLLLWSTICCLRCCFFFPLSPHLFHLNRLLFFTSYVSPRSGCFFHVICFIKTVCFFHVHNNN